MVEAGKVYVVVTIEVVVYDAVVVRERVEVAVAVVLSVVFSVRVLVVGTARVEVNVELITRVCVVVLVTSGQEGSP